MSPAIIRQRAEALVIFATGLALYWHWSDTVRWPLAIAIFFAPDLSLLGYLIGPKAGAFIYNVVHVYALGALLLTVGVLASLPYLAAAGALCLAHAGFDRMLGYGLKLSAGFLFTHLGEIGRRAQNGPKIE